MYSQPWSPTGLNDGADAAVPDAEALAGGASDIGFAAGGAIEGDVADDDIFFRNKG